MFQETHQKDIQLAKPIPAVDQKMDRLYTQGQEVEHTTLIHLEINHIRNNHVKVKMFIMHTSFLTLISIYIGF